jgi:SAM-dependent methyltransferase
MHKESYDIMEYFVEKYLDRNKMLEILDVGSFDVNGNYRELFKNNNWKYQGLDMIEGPNVDIVSKGPYDFGIYKQFDVIVSGNCLEHVEAPWKWIKEVVKVMKRGGIICIITPFSLGEHRYPVDCWRILPDGYRYLLEKENNFTILETKLNRPEPEIRYKTIQTRSEGFLKIFPGRIKEQSIPYKYFAIQDTFVIAELN